MKTLQAIWRRITTTRFASALEEDILPHMRALETELTRQRGEVARQCAETEQQRAEIGRLRAENRALLNSILGIAGVPPITVADAPPESTSHLPATAPVTPRRPKNAALVAPTRRRSWQQIHRTLEIAAAQKKQVHEDSLV